MNDEPGVSQTNPGRRHVLARFGVLIGCTLAAMAVVGPLAFHLGGPEGLKAATLAAMICLGGAASALMLAHALTGPASAYASVLGGMMLRMGLPLAAAIAVQQVNPLLAKAGFFYYMIVFYLLCLATEIPLSLPVGQRIRCSRKRIS